MDRKISTNGQGYRTCEQYYNQTYLTNIYRMLHPAIAEYILFVSEHNASFRIEDILYQKTSITNF